MVVQTESPADKAVPARVWTRWKFNYVAGLLSDGRASFDQSMRPDVIRYRGRISAAASWCLCSHARRHIQRHANKCIPNTLYGSSVCVEICGHVLPS